MGQRLDRVNRADQIAKEDAQERLSKHVMVEEPVRSFRFHACTVNTKVEQGKIGQYPFVKFVAPTEKVRFSYTSFYAFTLTWTPGHMTIVGDLGEMTVVHYNAMPTLEAACHWLLSPDFHYLLSKTSSKKEFQREATVEDLWHMLTERYAEFRAELAQETKAHEADKPKWLKRDGMTKAEFERELKYWEENHPRIQYGFRKLERPVYANRNLWSEDEKIGWRVPDGLERLARAWHDISEVSYGPSVPRDPNDLLTDEGLEQMREAVERYCYDRSDEEIASWVYHMIDSDYSGVYEYSQQAFFRMAAIQHGCRMILSQLEKEAPQKIAAQ